MIRSFRTVQNTLFLWPNAGKPVEEKFKGYEEFERGMTKIGTAKLPWGTGCGVGVFAVDSKRDLPKDGRPGEIYITVDRKEEWVWIDKWELVGRVDEGQYDSARVELATRPTNCINCGAVLKSNKCEYCGTEYT